MNGELATHYYRATGLSPYYFANVVYNVVKSPTAYLRAIEDLLGDMAGSFLVRSFHPYSNLHCFIEDVANDLFFEEPADKSENYLAVYFVKQIGGTHNLEDPNDIDELLEARNEQWFYEAFENLVEEVFVILFQNVGFLQRFNELTASYVFSYLTSFGEPEVQTNDHLKRVHIPQFVKDAVYFRDRGECRSCKKAIDRQISPYHKECFDHIVPLARGGANDISNIQLLCVPCNSEKSDKYWPVSDFYQRHYPAARSDQ